MGFDGRALASRGTCSSIPAESAPPRAALDVASLHRPALRSLGPFPHGSQPSRRARSTLPRAREGRLESVSRPNGHESGHHHDPAPPRVHRSRSRCSPRTQAALPKPRARAGSNHPRMRSERARASQEVVSSKGARLGRGADRGVWARSLPSQARLLARHRLRSPEPWGGSRAMLPRLVAVCAATGPASGMCAGQP